MFACQSGSEEMDRQHSGTVSPEGIALAEFLFKDGQYLVVKRGKLSEHATEAERCLQQAAQPGKASGSSCTAVFSAKNSTLPAQAVG
jgi:hypothetical protein